MPRILHAVTALALTLGAGLLLALPGVSSRAAAEGASAVPTRADCASIYYALTRYESDANYLAMVYQFHVNGDDSLDTARTTAKAGGNRLIKAVKEGRLDAGTVVDVAKKCENHYKVALPEISPTDFPAYASARAPSPSSAPTPAPPPPRATYSAPAPRAPEVSAACISANNEYRAILRTIPGKLDDAGPRMVPMCDDDRMMCRTMTPSSKFYYALGKICDSLKSNANSIRAACGAADVPEPLDECS